MTSVAVVIIASNDELHAILLIKNKLMVAMTIMTVEANNDGSNIKWSFAVVLEGGCCFIFGCFLWVIGVSGLFL